MLDNAFLGFNPAFPESIGLDLFETGLIALGVLAAANGDIAVVLLRGTDPFLALEEIAGLVDPVSLLLPTGAMLFFSLTGMTGGIGILCGGGGLISGLVFRGYSNK